MRRLLRSLAFVVVMGGGASMLQAEATSGEGEPQVCWALYGGESGCPEVTCSEKCPGWTDLGKYCLNNVMSCKGYPPAP